MNANDRLNQCIKHAKNLNEYISSSEQTKMLKRKIEILALLTYPISSSDSLYLTFV